jgi:hypothetical protein
LEVHKLAVL